MCRLYLLQVLRRGEDLEHLYAQVLRPTQRTLSQDASPWSPMTHVDSAPRVPRLAQAGQVIQASSPPFQVGRSQQIRYYNVTL
jgi:hypothetical protein